MQHEWRFLRTFLPGLTPFACSCASRPLTSTIGGLDAWGLEEQPQAHCRVGDFVPTNIFASRHPVKSWQTYEPRRHATHDALGVNTATSFSSISWSCKRDSSRVVTTLSETRHELQASRTVHMASRSNFFRGVERRHCFLQARAFWKSLLPCSCNCAEILLHWC